MNGTRFGLAGAVAAAFTVACGAPEGSENDEIGRTEQALGACGEAVPADRYIDGYPAFAQCPASENGPIFSRDGFDTSLTQIDPSWIRTQYSGGYQCTELAHRYIYFKWSITWLPRGNAGEWCDAPPPPGSGMVQTTVPVHGDLIVLSGGSCGAAQGTGHVAVVDTIDAARSRVSAVQQNRASRGSYDFSCARCFLHVEANSSGVVAPGAGGAPVTTPPEAGGAPPWTPPAAGGTPTAPPWAPPQETGGAPAWMPPSGTGGAPSPAPTMNPPWPPPPAAGTGGVPGGAVWGAGGAPPGGAPASNDEPSDSSDDGGLTCALGGRRASSGPADLSCLAGYAVALGMLARRRRYSRRSGHL